MAKRSYAGEMEWALEQVNSRNYDTNKNRSAQIRTAIDYGLEVARARRSHAAIPERPDLDKAI